MFLDQKLLFLSGFLSFPFVLSFVLNYYASHISLYSLTHRSYVYKLFFCFVLITGFRCLIYFVDFYHYFRIEHTGEMESRRIVFWPL